MIILPWPDKSLSPNARLHWSKKAKAAKVQRQIAGWETVVSGHKIIWEGPIHLKITFYPPDMRCRDMDNLSASMKSAFDGIADALKVNDSRFRHHLWLGLPVKGGSVTVEVKQHE